MQDTAIKNFCTGARRELMAEVALRARRYGITDEGYEPATSEVVGGYVLSAAERRQRAELIRRLGPAAAEGYREAWESLVDEAAYTWFNRLVAIRFMELNDRLPSHVRVLSAEDGSFAPQVLREALDVSIEGLDAAEVSALVAASDDEALFRCLFLAQCRELSACLPDVFEPVGAAMELLLPDGLLRQGTVVHRLVIDIPEEDWREGVEIVGWMYQYYVSERKDEVFASFKKGKKADPAAIAPATQLFTPDWIVRYLTENSLGRLWMRSHPASRLSEQMPYYIPDDLSAEADSGTEGGPDAENGPGASVGGDFSRPSEPASPVGGDFSRPSGPAMSPESACTALCHSERSVEDTESKNLGTLPLDSTGITVIDPACGSGHILVYAFRLLAAMYEESGHARRDIPRLILENNLTGCEIDPRAAQLASFALAMTACEWDSRFLRRTDKARANVVCLRPAVIDPDELEQMPYLAERTALLDAMAHMGECGSLFVPEPEDIAALERADDELDAREAGGDLLAYAPHEAVSRMLANCAPLAKTYDVVIANPPYMGSSNMDKWLANWTKRNYPDSKRDLCTCFIERGFTLAKPEGYSAMVTMQSWMFLGSFETMREKMLGKHGIDSMAHLGTRAFDAIGGEVVATTATVFRNSSSADAASYLRLVDFDGEASKEQAIREAIANPDCGWFYRRSSDSFKSIPGTPIAYWASDAIVTAFAEGVRLDRFARPLQGMATGDNDRFLRLWWEVDRGGIGSDCEDEGLFHNAGFRYVPHNKGGEFRRWYGNIQHILRYTKSCVASLEHMGNHLPSRSQYFNQGISYSDLTSGSFSARQTSETVTFDTTGPMLFPSKEDISYILGCLNSTVFQALCNLKCTGLHYSNGVLAELPIIEDAVRGEYVNYFVRRCRHGSELDWDSKETSLGFSHHPMV